MHGLDIIGADPALGISWGDVGDVGKAAFPYVHATGKGIASAFGAGAAAQALENVEQKQGWLPPTEAPIATTVATTVQNVATVATPKLHPDVKKPSTGEKTSKAEKAKTGISTTQIILGVGLLGFIALVIRRMLA